MRHIRAEEAVAATAAAETFDREYQEIGAKKLHKKKFSYQQKRHQEDRDLRTNKPHPPPRQTVDLSMCSSALLECIQEHP
eukprot:scaffold124950_cov36-Attheya_sp.AAC.1